MEVWRAAKLYCQCHRKPENLCVPDPSNRNGLQGGTSASPWPWHQGRVPCLRANSCLRLARATNESEVFSIGRFCCLFGCGFWFCFALLWWLLPPYKVKLWTHTAVLFSFQCWTSLFHHLTILNPFGGFVPLFLSSHFIQLVGDPFAFLHCCFSGNVNNLAPEALWD